VKLQKVEDYLPEYWEGSKNILIRTWTYIKIGLTQVNDYKYVAAAVFAVYYTLKLVNPIWIVVMFVVSLPSLAILGHWWLYKGAKTSEFVSAQKGSVLGYSAYNAQIRIIELLEQILNKLNESQHSDSP
jgi:hypothetical protein